MLKYILNKAFKEHILLNFKVKIFFSQKNTIFGHRFEFFDERIGYSDSALSFLVEYYDVLALLGAFWGNIMMFGHCFELFDEILIHFWQFFL
ncbi:hypothetical protein D8B45_01130 [Candidatus Gracilibacteria bacterium]|nr:MAG: hypothetical protein D8B45_01130 [Candidatus Gracilibacteria bacterium]